MGTLLRIAYIRLGLLLCGLGYTVAVLYASKTPASFPPDSLLACTYFSVANIICLLLIRRYIQTTGKSWAHFIGFQRNHISRDCAWAVLWFFVLYIPFFLCIMLIPLALYGPTGFSYLETAFVPSHPTILPKPVTIILAFTAALVFPLVNAPAEEVIYRGLILENATQPTFIVLTIQAALFAINHLLFAPTMLAAGIYAIAFFLWGFGAGIIVKKQQRLMPMIISHFLVNAIMALPALTIIFI